ncbi:hypothetical protein BC940DRAFT_251444 [Gongronella butleri]|nr:hypothetical protein BC940DRAFT_251444 [Gongronella butleri]
MKKVVLRWSNKEDASTTDIHPDAVISSVVQQAFGNSLGFGETEPGDASTTNHSLRVDTLKLAILARNAALKHGRPILTFQANGK